MSEFCLVQLKAQIFFNPYLITDDKREYLLNITIPDFEKYNCFIGNQKVHNINFKNIVDKTNDPSDISRDDETSWIVDIDIEEQEIKTIFPNTEWYRVPDKILKTLCQELTLRSIIECTYLDGHGFNEFSYRLISNQKIGGSESELSICDIANWKEISNLISTCDLTVIPDFWESNICPKPDSLIGLIERQFLRAMVAGDSISRFLLLYVIFEEIYKDPKYQQLKKAWESQNLHKKANEKRAELLLKWLGNECSIKEYSFCNPCDRSDIEKFYTKKLTKDTLLKIIDARNNLFHRGTSMNISDIMYFDMIPIIIKLIQIKDKRFDNKYFSA